MERVARLSKRMALSYRTLPEKKKYLDIITALLSIPMLITVLILNIHSLNAKKDAKASTSNATAEKIIVTIPSNTSNLSNSSSSNKSNKSSANNLTISPSPSQGPCKQGIGPITIASPNEGDTVSDNPVSIDVEYNQGNYCAVVWSYRINGGQWSDFDDKSIALYNPPSGKVKLELKVKSIVNSDEKSLTRNFIYAGPTAAPTQASPTASSSAN